MIQRSRSLFWAAKSFIVGNITQQRVDAIINTANSTLLGGGAVEDFLTADNTLKEVRLVFYKMNDASLFLKNHKFNAGV
jgi:O-acetyl-ADP-ribose deacetylase (regulator of RNase III)